MRKQRCFLFMMTFLKYDPNNLPEPSNLTTLPTVWSPPANSLVGSVVGFFRIVSGQPLPVPASPLPSCQLKMLPPFPNLSCPIPTQPLLTWCNMLLTGLHHSTIVSIPLLPSNSSRLSSPLRARELGEITMNRNFFSHKIQRIVRNTQG